jgi:hypothetical protein
MNHRIALAALLALSSAGFALAQAPAAVDGLETVKVKKVDSVDLFVNAPDTMAAGRSRTYAMNAGEMRLALEISDSVTGTVLARARDRKRGSESGRIE